MNDFYRNKKVLVTGHTGFKGSWLCRVLVGMGAEVTGYSLSPPTTPNLYDLSEVNNHIHSVIADVRDLDTMRRVFEERKPEIVIHMAAQPIVIESYRNPVYTYETNVMGTVNLLECVRMSGSVKSILNVTTDKVYKNNEWEWGYREDEQLDGYDPYSNSKSCAELVTHSYQSSFLSEKNVAVSTARAGNVIGGGDFADKRIIPDCVRAMKNGVDIEIRNPYSTRPYQHVLEPLFAYLLIVQKQYEDIKYAGWYNVGPDDCDCITTGELVDLFCSAWGPEAHWKNVGNVGPHEAKFLKLDCSKIKFHLQWNPRWTVKTAIEKTCEWSKAWLAGDNVARIMDQQINSFIEGQL